MQTFKNILHPTDFSRTSEFALGLACGLARDHGAHLVILHVLPPRKDLEASPDRTAEKLERLPLPGLPVRAERMLKVGEPAEVIVATAAELGCDLIVMGTHGWTGEARQLMGSVAEAVHAKAACPVVTAEIPMRVAQPAEEPAEEGISVLL